jgi:tRNA(adenine34) deaminase
MLTIFSDEHFMKQAFEQAKMAYEKGELPIGAVIVVDNKIIARAYNQTEVLNDFTAHAEMLAFTSASEFFGNKYLNKCTLYVTLEPCVMCAGASVWPRVGKVDYGASDPKRGFTGVSTKLLHPKTSFVGGVMQQQCSDLLNTFFENKRKE